MVHLYWVVTGSSISSLAGKKSSMHVSTTVDGLLHKHHALFKDELGTMTGVQAWLSVKPDSTPKFCRARATPYALHEAIEKDLTRLQHMGV